MRQLSKRQTLTSKAATQNQRAKQDVPIARPCSGGMSHCHCVGSVFERLPSSWGWILQLTILGFSHRERLVRGDSICGAMWVLQVLCAVLMKGHVRNQAGGGRRWLHQRGGWTRSQHLHGDDRLAQDIQGCRLEQCVGWLVLGQNGGVRNWLHGRCSRTPIQHLQRDRGLDQ